MPKKKNGQAVSEVDPSFGPQMDIPNRAERKALLKEMAEAAKKGLREDAPGAGKYAVYAEKMQALDEQMDELSALDEWGIPKPLTAEQKAALAAAMEETAMAGEAYLAWPPMQPRRRTCSRPTSCSRRSTKSTAWPPRRR